MSALVHGRQNGSTASRPSDGFAVVRSTHALGFNLPQQAGRKLWAPMLAMALMGFAAALVLGLARSAQVTAAGAADTAAVVQLSHYATGAMFIGFLSVFSAITFAIARILGEFRQGGGQVQEAAGVGVQTLRMPMTAKGMLVFMMMGMMAIAVPVALHFVVGAGVGGGTVSLVQAEQAAGVLEGVRRLGVGLYLFAITLGLATIVHVLRFQAIRIREVADEIGRPAQG
jgi:hypothetical protein